MLCNIAMLLCYSTLFSLITGALTTFQTYFFKYLYGYETEEEEDLAGHTYLKEKKNLLSAKVNVEPPLQEFISYQSHTKLRRRSAHTSWRKEKQNKKTPNSLG